jgi:hypothetical protein
MALGTSRQDWAVLVNFVRSSNASAAGTTTILKIVCGLVCFLIFASNVWSMSHWSEARGVYDDICYLRQAHLFKEFGPGGLDTNLARDDDHYLASKLKEIRFPASSVPPCHSLMPATKKTVMQYPPGTGLVLALFPEGFQVIPLYVLATAIVFGFGLLAINYAATISSVLATALLGDLAVYLMINPTKASYSMAPTMVVCALAGFLTARLFAAEQPRRLLLTGLVGLLIGGRQFQIAQSVARVRILPVFPRLVFTVPHHRDVLARRGIRHHFPGGNGADAARQRDQCRQSVLDDLWRG